MPSDPSDTAYWYALATLPSLTLRDLHRIARVFPNGRDAWTASATALVHTGIPTARSVAIVAERAVTNPHLPRVPVHALCRTDTAYPGLLRHIAAPPVVLTYRGSAPDLRRPAVAVVGTRRPSAYGRALARSIATTLVDAGCVTVSGLAFGIDAEVHQATVAAGGTTWAVLGSGVLNVSPRTHAPLAERIIAEGGSILSEFPPTTEARPEHFPIRNRIIAGLSVATVVVEAPASSGALITARSALDANREVFAVPHDVSRASGRGCNALIRAGAEPYLDAESFLARLFPDTHRPTAPNPSPTTADEHAVVSALAAGPMTIDECTERSGLPVGRVAAALTALVGHRVVTDLGGQRYQCAGVFRESSEIQH